MTLNLLKLFLFVESVQYYVRLCLNCLLFVIGIAIIGVVNLMLCFSILAA